MKMQRVAVGLTLINIVLLFLSLRAGAPVSAAVTDAFRNHAVPTVVRTRMLELVDEHGQVRSRLRVEPDGEVVLRLLDSDGQVRVKLGAGESGSGLVLLDEETEPAVHLLARRSGTRERPSTTSVTLTTGDGRRQVIKP